MQHSPEKSPIHFKEYEDDLESPSEKDVLKITLEDKALQDIKSGQGFMSLLKTGKVIIIKGTNFSGQINTIARMDLT
jgi:hypothetical protein